MGPKDPERGSSGPSGPSNFVRERLKKRQKFGLILRILDSKLDHLVTFGQKIRQLVDQQEVGNVWRRGRYLSAR